MILKSEAGLQKAVITTRQTGTPAAERDDEADRRFIISGAFSI